MKTFFRGDIIPEPHSEYVCWLDVMGTQTTMSFSLVKSVNYICRLHIAALDFISDPIAMYPMLDGMYITCERQWPLLEFLRNVFGRVAEDFLEAKQEWHRFLVRAAIAYGPIVHGEAIPEDAAKAIETFPAHWGALLFGIPIIQAFRAERQAPPFGVFIHESARSFAPTGDRLLPFTWWKWFQKQDLRLGSRNSKTAF